MPTIPTVLAGSTLANGLSAHFRDGYGQATGTRQHELLAKVMDLGLPSTARQTPYAYYETAPYPRLNLRGNPVPFKPFASKSFTIINYNYELGIGWHEDDRADDQIQGLYDRASAGGRNWGTLKERFLVALETSTPGDLLPATPNAADGAALFSATDGASAARFGLSGGNIESGGGVASAAAVRTDFWQARARFAGFQDTEGQPLWDGSFLDKGFVIRYPAAHEELFREAFLQGRTLAGALTSTSNAAVTNTILESGIPIWLWPTQRLSGNDWYVYAVGSQHKAVFEQTRQDLMETIATRDNSDHARLTGEEWIQWKSRHGVGVFLPYQAVKVDN